MSSHKLPQTIRAPYCHILVNKEKTKVRLQDTRHINHKEWTRASAEFLMIKHNGKWVPGPEIVALKKNLLKKYGIKKKPRKSPGPRQWEAPDPRDRKFKWNGKVILLKTPKVTLVRARFE